MSLLSRFILAGLLGTVTSQAQIWKQVKQQAQQTVVDAAAKASRSRQQSSSTSTGSQSSLTGGNFNDTWFIYCMAFGDQSKPEVYFTDVIPYDHSDFKATRNIMAEFDWFAKANYGSLRTSCVYNQGPASRNGEAMTRKVKQDAERRLSPQKVVDVAWAPSGLTPNQATPISTVTTSTPPISTKIASTSAAAQTAPPPTQQNEQAAADIKVMRGVDISVLEQCVGLSGKVTKPEDIDKLKLVITELNRRAHGGDLNAMYALAREAEHPSVKGSEPDYKAAVSWYTAGTTARDTRAEYHLGDLYVRGLGVPDNVPLRVVREQRRNGQYWMQYAQIHGYLPEKDRMRNDAERQVETLSVLEGIGAWMSAASPGNSSDSSRPVNMPSSTKSCTKTQRTWVSTDSHDPSKGHWQSDSYLAYGSSCP